MHPIHSKQRFLFTPTTCLTMDIHSASDAAQVFHQLLVYWVLPSWSSVDYLVALVTPSSCITT